MNTLKSPPPDNGLASAHRLTVEGQSYRYHRLTDTIPANQLSRLPFCIRILIENIIRGDDTGHALTRVRQIAGKARDIDVPFRPGRVLLQDFLGIPAMLDLASLRDAVARAGGDAQSVNPKIPTDIVIDHSTIADFAGTPDAHRRNVDIMYSRNQERLQFLAWCQRAFRNFRAFPPESGIMHQVNLEFISRVVWTEYRGAEQWVYPDTMVGTDSHTTMVNGMGVLGWGVGGLDAEAAMLGRPLFFQLPKVAGVSLTGRLQQGVTATDLVLTLTQALRNHGVVGKFLEFCGSGLDGLTLADRATIANMAPEYGATCAYFPVDSRCLDYLRSTGRTGHHIALVEAYCRAQHLWRDDTTAEPEFDEIINFDLSSVEPCIAGPLRPSQRTALKNAGDVLPKAIASLRTNDPTVRSARVEGKDYSLSDGDIVIAAITSCTNTANPEGMVLAGLLARNAIARGLAPRPWIKTSLAPGSRTVTDYLHKAGLLEPLQTLGFHLVGYACSTCNGNSGPLAPEIDAAIERERLVASAVLSGNRNFEGRIHPSVRAAFLCSPALVVAYALAGNMAYDPVNQSLGTDQEGRPVYLADLWPSADEVRSTMNSLLDPQAYLDAYKTALLGDERWSALCADSSQFDWRTCGTYLRPSPFFDNIEAETPQWPDLSGLRPLLVLGNDITTDHIAPNGAIAADSLAGHYLARQGVPGTDFNTYGTRRGNHELAIRSIFISKHLRNEVAPGAPGGSTIVHPEGKTTSVFEAAATYATRGESTLIVTGKNYGAGSSRDWAAKGVRLLGSKVVLAESFERIHRSNLVSVGVLPLQFAEGQTRETLMLRGDERFDVEIPPEGLEPNAHLRSVLRRADGTCTELSVLCRLDTPEEIECYRQGGILSQIFREFVARLPLPLPVTEE